MNPIVDCSSAAFKELGSFGDGIVFHDSKDTLVVTKTGR